MKSKTTLTTSFDRTVYPLDAMMHLRASIDKKSKEKEIIFSIYNFKHKKIISKIIICDKSVPVSKGKNHVVYETSIKMKGKLWKIGEQYGLVTTHGNEIAVDKMIIAKRNSAIISDKSAYVLGSDAIITVIAPDFDLDNEKVDVIGNKKNNLITISSSKGKISGYELRETGESTGIFQGIIGFLPPIYSKDGKRKSYPKSKGKGPHDGYIPAIIDDEITIKFKNKYETIKQSIRIANFGAAIELDQKIYAHDDKVYVTIIAPDCNFDSDKTDYIGNRKDCTVSVSTSLGKLSNYVLKETSIDTGIFTGEIQLKPVLTIETLQYDKHFKFVEGFGPTHGKLACRENDEINVTFDFESTRYTAAAIIKKLLVFNISKINSDLRNLYNYLDILEDDVYVYNSLPQPKVGAQFAPQWSDVQRDIFLRMDIEKYQQNLNVFISSLKKILSSDYKVIHKEIILEIVDLLKDFEIKFIQGKAYISRTNNLKNLILKYMKKTRGQVKDQYTKKTSK